LLEVVAEENPEVVAVAPVDIEQIILLLLQADFQFQHKHILLQ
jgi:hypothetical protein